jgi:hypothetical protein
MFNITGKVLELLDPANLHDEEWKTFISASIHQTPFPAYYSFNSRYHVPNILKSHFKYKSNSAEAQVDPLEKWWYKTDTEHSLEGKVFS